MIQILRRHAIAPLTILLMLSLEASAVPAVFEGTDIGLGTVNSDAAFAAWSASVGSFTLDPLDGLAGAAGFGGTLTSALGNRFTAVDDLLFSNTFGVGVIQDEHLRVARVGNAIEFEWTLAEAADAFGFFARNNQGSLVTVAFDDGGTMSFELIADAAGNGDNLFFGVDGLGSAIASVSITSAGPPPLTTLWDRFVYRPAAVVPEPSTLALALAGVMVFRRGRN